MASASTFQSEAARTSPPRRPTRCTRDPRRPLSEAHDRGSGRELGWPDLHRRRHGPDDAAPPCDQIGSLTRSVLALSNRGRTVWIRSDENWGHRHENSATSLGAGGGVVTMGVTRTIEGYADYHGRIIAFTPRDTGLGERVRGSRDPVGSADSVADLATDAEGRTYAAGHRDRPSGVRRRRGAPGGQDPGSLPPSAFRVQDLVAARELFVLEATGSFVSQLDRPSHLFPPRSLQREGRSELSRTRGNSDDRGMNIEGDPTPLVVLFFLVVGVMVLAWVALIVASFRARSQPPPAVTSGLETGGQAVDRSVDGERGSRPPGATPQDRPWGAYALACLGLTILVFLVLLSIIVGPRLHVPATGARLVFLFGLCAGVAYGLLGFRAIVEGFKDHQGALLAISVLFSIGWLAGGAVYLLLSGSCALSGGCSP
jgi:hypothetical protein